MRNVRIPERVEIAFWSAFVGILAGLKPRRSADRTAPAQPVDWRVYIALLALGLVLTSGLLAGEMSLERLVKKAQTGAGSLLAGLGSLHKSKAVAASASQAGSAQLRPASAQPAASAEPPTATPAAGSARPNGQRNLLLISVDNLQAAHPRLESTWLVLSLPDEDRLTLIPLYPVYITNTRPQSNFLSSVFQLGPGSAPAPAFLQALSGRGLWWNHYVVVDEMGLAELADLAGGVSVDANSSSGLRAVAGLPLPWSNPTAALLAQTAFLGELCGRMGGLAATNDPAAVLTALAHHLSSDFQAEEILAGWTQLGAAGNLSCEFPTLHQGGANKPLRRISP